MSIEKSKNDLPKKFHTTMPNSELATFESVESAWGPLIVFLLIEYGSGSIKSQDCIVEIVNGPDAGSRFVADVLVPHRLEPHGIILKKKL